MSSTAYFFFKSDRTQQKLLKNFTNLKMFLLLNTYDNENAANEKVGMYYY